MYPDSSRDGVCVCVRIPRQRNVRGGTPVLRSGGPCVGGRFKRQGTYVYLWLIHVDVWQKLT